MTEYHVMYWRDLPSMVVARDGSRVAKQCLPERFHDAIDAAVEHVAEDDSNAALAGWRRGRWQQEGGSPTSVASQVADRLTHEWPTDAVEEYLDGMDVDLQPASSLTR